MHMLAALLFAGFFDVRLPLGWIGFEPMNLVQVQIYSLLHLTALPPSPLVSWIGFLALFRLLLICI